MVELLLYHHTSFLFMVLFILFARLQMRYFRENYESLAQLETKLDAQTRKDYMDGTLDLRLDLCLAKMRELQA